MTSNFYKNPFNKSSLVNILKICDKRNKEKVLKVLINNNNLLLQLSCLTIFKKIYLKNFNILNLYKVKFFFKKQVSTVIKNFVKNSNRMLIFYRNQTSFVKTVKLFLFKNNIIINKQKLQFNFNQIFLLNEFYSIMLEIFNENNFSLNIKNFTSYKYEKGFMQDSLNYKQINPLNLFVSIIFNNINSFNRVALLNKRNILSKKNRNINLQRNLMNLEFKKYIIFFYLNMINKLKLNKKKISYKFFMIFLNEFFFITKLFRRNNIKKFSYKEIFVKHDYMKKFLILSKDNIFYYLLRVKYLFLLFNEKFNKKK